MIIRTELIRTPEQYDDLENFACSFNHEINRNLPYVLFKDEKGRFLAYLALVNIPVGIPAMSPTASPRELVEVARAMTGWALVQYGEAYVAVPPETAFDEYLKKHGFRDDGLRLLHHD